jgi:FkbM family methyltransferase
MKERGGFCWPDGDTVTPEVVLREVERLPQYLQHVQDPRRICVQAGGNVGVYANFLVDCFQQVFTFEPDPQNYECLLANNGKSKSERFYHPKYGALGNQEGNVTTWRSTREWGNYGATQVRLGNAPHAAPIIMLDKVLPHVGVDFMLLDVEGWEQPALEGAEEIIRVSHPVIALELKGHGEPYGWPDSYTRNWLHEREYRKVDRIGNDDIFVWTPLFAS